MAEAGEIVLAVGIDHRVGRRQFGADLVMVDHHDVEPEPPAPSASASKLVEPQSTQTTSRGAGLGELASSPRGWGRSPRRCGRECRSPASRPTGAQEARRAAPPRSRRRRRSRRRSRSARRRRSRRRSALAAASMSVSAEGSGISRFSAGSRKSGTSSAATPRPASTRATMSGSAWRWAIACATRARLAVEPLDPAPAGQRPLDAEEGAPVLRSVEGLQHKQPVRSAGTAASASPIRALRTKPAAPPGAGGSDARRRTSRGPGARP